MPNPSCDTSSSSTTCCEETDITNRIAIVNGRAVGIGQEFEGIWNKLCKLLDAVDALHGRILKSLNSAQIELALPIQTIQLKGEGLIEQQQIKSGS